MWDTPWTMFKRFLKETWNEMGETELLPHFSLRLTLLLAVLLVTALYAASAQASVRQDARDAVVLFKDASPGSGSFCTAVITAPGKLLTAAHCTEHFGSAKTYVVTEDGKKHPVVKYDQRGQFNEEGRPVTGTPDLAILYAPTVTCPCALLAESPPVRDEHMLGAGYPFNVGKIVTEGRFQGRALWLGNEYLIADVAGGSGVSGGGLFAVRDGMPRLVGIIVASAGFMTLSVELTR